MGSTVSVPTTPADNDLHTSVMAALITSIINIFLTAQMLIFVIYHRSKNFGRKHKKSKLHHHQNINTNTIYIMSYITFINILLPSLAFVFIRMNYQHNVSYTRCMIGHTTFYLTNFSAQFCSSTLFLIRLYSVFPSKRNLHIVLSTFIAVILSACFIHMYLQPKSFQNRIIDEKLRFCGNSAFAYFVIPINNAKHRVHPLYVVPIFQTLYNLYVLLVFVYNLCKLRTNLDGVHAKLRTNAVRNRHHDQMLKQMICRMFVLVMISVLVSCTFLFVITQYIPSTVAISIPLTVDAICSFLLFFVNEECVCTLCACTCFVKASENNEMSTEHASSADQTKTSKEEMERTESRKFKITSRGDVVYEANSVQEYSHKESREHDRCIVFDAMVDEVERMPIKLQQKRDVHAVSQISYTDATLHDTSCVAAVLSYDKTI